LDTLGILFQESLAVFLSSDGCACKDQVDNIKYVHSMGFWPYKYIYIIYFVLYVTYLCPMICLALSDTLMDEILKHMKLDWKGKTTSQLSMNWAPRNVAVDAQ
jgi:hypothetical protein